ncbi:hypothetical protein Emag_000963 [Eimeria magna]
MEGPSNCPDMFDVADDLDQQRHAMHAEILQLLEKEENERQARRAGIKVPARSRQSSIQSSSYRNSGSSSSCLTWRGFDFPQAGIPQLTTESTEGPGSFLSAFVETLHGKLSQREASSHAGRPLVPGGPQPLAAAIASLKDLAAETRLRGDALNEDTRFAALLAALDRGLKHELLRTAVAGMGTQMQQRFLEARVGDGSMSNDSRSGFNSAGLEEGGGARSSQESNSKGRASGSSRSSVLSPQQLCSVAHALARLRIKSSSVDGVLRSLVFLGIYKAKDFSVEDGFCYLLSLSAAATSTYQPIQKALLKAFRGPLTRSFLDALAATSSTTTSNNRGTNSSPSCKREDNNDGGSSDSRRCTTGLSLARQLLLLLPLFVSLDLHASELPACLEALACTSIWPAAAAAMSPQELTAATAVAAASSELRGATSFWLFLRAAAERLGPSMPPSEVTSLCEIFSQVGRDFGAVLLAAQKPLQQQAALLPSSEVYAAARLAAAAANRLPKLQPLLALLKQQLQQRAENASCVYSDHLSLLPYGLASSWRDSGVKCQDGCRSNVLRSTPLQREQRKTEVDSRRGLEQKENSRTPKREPADG